MSDVQTPTSKPIESDMRLMAALVYGLFLFSIPTHGLTALIGVIVAYVKRSDARGTIYESHFGNAITVFWVTLVVWLLFVTAIIAGVVTFFGAYGWPHFGHWHAHEWTGQMHDWRSQVEMHQWPEHWWPLIGIVPVAWLACVGFVIWYFYRVIRGLVRVLDNKAY
jgi:uncharacterized membrane protein